MFVLALAALAACDDTVFNSHQVAVEGDGYEAVVALMDANCAMCHGGPAPAVNLALDGDLCEALVNVEIGSGILVVPGDSSASVFMDRITSVSAPMPPSGVMSDDSLGIVRDWIDNGAVCSTDDPSERDSDTGDSGSANQ